MKKMNISLLLGLSALLVLSIPSAFAAEDTPWFDLENCSMCKYMTAEEGLMEHMEWENLLTNDGMMSVTVVDSKYEEAFQRSMINMEAAGMKLMSGEQMYLCGFCQSYGTLHMAGANFENFETDMGYISLATSHDPAVVQKIHAHAQKTIDEYAIMMAAEGEGDHPHKGHDHPNN